MNSSHVDLVSTQPFIISASSTYQSLQHTGNKFFREIDQFVIPSEQKVRLLPDCFTTLLIKCENDFDPVLVTPTTSAGREFTFPSGCYYGVKLTPFCSYALYRVLSSTPDFADSCVPAHKVFADIDSLAHDVGTSENSSCALKLLRAYFEDVFRFAPIEPHIEDLIFRIVISNGTMSEKELSEASGLSTRYIYKLFKLNIGCSQKMFTRILRFQNAILAMRSCDVSSLSNTAYELNYYDQSHFLHEFKKFCGMLPSEMQRLLTEARNA